MSVNYDCYIIKGWRFPPGNRETVNELTNYKYEDEWKRPDNYTGNDCDDFLGETIMTIPVGEYASLTKMLANVISSDMSADRFPFGEVRLALANNLDLYQYVAGEPLIYIVNSIW